MRLIKSSALDWMHITALWFLIGLGVPTGMAATAMARTHGFDAVVLVLAGLFLLSVVLVVVVVISIERAAVRRFKREMAQQLLMLGAEVRV